MLMNKKVVDRLEKYFSSYKLISYRKGDTIIYSTDEPNGVYYLKKGYVKMNIVSIDGNELILNIHKPGSFFSTFWAIGEKPNSYSFIAMDKVTIYKSPKEDFLVFLKENPEVLFDLTKRVLSGVDELVINITHLLAGSSENRVASALSIVTKRFGEKMKDGKILIKLNLTHQDIADMAGITRETASLAIGKLTKNKILKQQGRKFVIFDINKLDNITSY